MGIFIAMGTLGFSLGPLLSAFTAQYFGLDKMHILAVLGVVWACLMFALVPKFSDEKSNKVDINLKQAFTDILTNQKLNILNIIAILKSLMTTSCSILLPFCGRQKGIQNFK